MSSAQQRERKREHRGKSALTRRHEKYWAARRARWEHEMLIVTSELIASTKPVRRRP